MQDKSTNIAQTGINYLKQYGPGLISNNYRIVPIKRGTKAPSGVRGWQNIHADQRQLDSWLSQGFEGVGVHCKHNPAVDIDVLDEEVSSQMVDAVLQQYPGGLARVGKAPKTLLTYRTDKPFKKVRSSTYKDKDGNCHAVEILGDGQQYVAYAEHPETHQPYKWQGDGLFEVKAEDLSILNVEDALKIVKMFEDKAKEKCISAGWVKIREGTASSVKPEYSLRESPDFTPANLASHRPPLDLSVSQVRRDLTSVQPMADNYDSWLHIGMALWHQFSGSQEGFDLWHEWSVNSTEFDGVEALGKRWNGFQPGKGCRPITFASVRRWARDARMVEDPQTAFLERYVYVADGDCVHDLEGLAHDKPFELKEFKNLTANIRTEIEVDAPIVADPDRTVPKIVPVHSQWMVDPDRKSAQGFQYVPGGAEILKDVEGRQWINNFHMPVFPKPCEPNSPEEAELLGPFFRHMEYIIPVEEEREWFYSWMAFNVQRPGVRCKVTPLLIATAHGTGRGWIVQLMNLLLGSWNCSKTKMSTLNGDSSAGQFQDFMNDMLLCAVEEVKDADKPYGVLDSIRSYLTEDTLEINLKYGAKETKRVYTNFLWNSNHTDALVLKDEDRRVNVFKTEDGPKDNDYYDRLYGWLEAEDSNKDGINAQEETMDGIDSVDVVYDRAGMKVSTGVACLFHWLKNRDLTNFNDKRSMPNKARQDLIENSQTDIEYFFLEMVKNPPYEIMTLAEIEIELEMQKDLSSNAVCSLSDSEKNQIKKLTQQHLGKQERTKISRVPEPNGDGCVTLEKPYEVHYWSLDKKKTFNTKEMREIHVARKKVANQHHFKESATTV